MNNICTSTDIYNAHVQCICALYILIRILSITTCTCTCTCSMYLIDNYIE